MKHEFVDSIPERLTNDVLYISLKYGTAAHQCCCGCGSEVVTPITPTDWLIIYDGENVSLYPSVGNWNLKCKSHYWIRDGKIVWAETWSEERIATGKLKDRSAKNEKYGERNAGAAWKAIKKRLPQ